MLVSVAGDCSAARHACYVVDDFSALCLLAFVAGDCSAAMHACCG